MGKRILCMIMIGMTMLLSGCYDQVEVSDELYAIMLGVDAREEGGVTLTLILPVYGGESSGEQQEQSENRVFTVEADNVYEGLNQMHLQIARGVSLLHLKLIVFSEEIARSGLFEYATAIRQHIETRNVMGVMITDGTAEEYISFMSESTTGVLSQELEQLLFRSRNNIYFPVRTFEEFCRDMESDYGQSYAIYSKSVENSGELYGTAMFQGGTMVGVLDKYQSACTMMVRGEFDGGMMTVGDMVVDIDGHPKVKIKAEKEKGQPAINLYLKLRGGFMEGEDPGHPVRSDDDIARGIEDYMRETVQKTQECGSDIWGFGKVAASCFTTIPQWEEYDWNSRYPQADIHVTVEFKTVKTEVNKR